MDRIAKCLETAKIIKAGGMNGKYAHNSSQHNNEILNKMGFTNGEEVEIDKNYTVGFYARKGDIGYNIEYKGRIIQNSKVLGL